MTAPGGGQAREAHGVHDAFVAAAWPDLVGVAALVVGREHAAEVTSAALADVVASWGELGGAPNLAVRRALVARVIRLAGEHPPAGPSADVTTDPVAHALLAALAARPPADRLDLALADRLLLTEIEVADLTARPVDEVTTGLDATREALRAAYDTERDRQGLGPAPWALDGAVRDALDEGSRMPWADPVALVADELRRRRRRRTLRWLGGMAAVAAVALVLSLVPRPWFPPGPRPVASASDPGWESLLTWPARGDYYPPAFDEAGGATDPASGAAGSVPTRPTRPTEMMPDLTSGFVPPTIEPGEHLVYAGTDATLGRVVVTTTEVPQFDSEMSGGGDTPVAVITRTGANAGSSAAGVDARVQFVSRKEGVVAAWLHGSFAVVLARPGLATADLLTGFELRADGSLGARRRLASLRDGVAVLSLPGASGVSVRRPPGDSLVGGGWTTFVRAEEDPSRSAPPCGRGCPPESNAGAVSAAQEATMFLHGFLGIALSDLRHLTLPSVTLPPGTVTGVKPDAGGRQTLDCVATSVTGGPVVRTCSLSFTSAQSSGMMAVPLVVLPGGTDVAAQPITWPRDLFDGTHPGEHVVAFTGATARAVATVTALDNEGRPGPAVRLRNGAAALMLPDDADGTGYRLRAADAQGRALGTWPLVRPHVADQVWNGAYDCLPVSSSTPSPYPSPTGPEGSPECATSP